MAWHQAPCVSALTPRWGKLEEGNLHAQPLSRNPYRFMIKNLFFFSLSFSYDPRLTWFWWDRCIAYQSWACQLHTSVVCGMNIAANLDLFEWSAPLSKPTEPFLLMTHSWAAIKHCVTISHTALSGDLFNYLNLPTCPKYGSFPKQKKGFSFPIILTVYF